MDELVILIDREDAALFFTHAYCPVKKHRCWYLSRNGENRTYYFHQDIMNAPKGYEIDHINNNGLDNRKSNLRIVNHQTNQFNMRKRLDSSSAYIGVHFCRQRNNYVAQCQHKNKTVNIGRFESEEEAAWARENFILLNNSPSRKNFSNENKL
jgi:hypothetical protein